MSVIVVLSKRGKGEELQAPKNYNSQNPRNVMTKKDYEVIASVIKVSKISKQAKEIIEQNFCYEFLKQNPRFDIKKFLLACRVME
jgi:hypothetical protein